MGLQDFRGKGKAMHRTRSESWSQQTSLGWLVEFQFLQVFDCKGFMSHVSHSAAFGLDQMCFKMFRNKRGDSFRSARAPALVRLGREGR